MDKGRYRVFISSTIEDLTDARESVEKILEALEIFDTVRVEKLPAISEPSHRVCLDEVRQADAVVLIIGAKYGFVPPNHNVEKLSVTHLEFREARTTRKPVFAFILSTNGGDEDVKRFLKDVEDFHEGVFRKKWDTPERLGLEVRRSLLWWIAKLARTGSSAKVSKDTIIRKLQVESLDEIALSIESAIEPSDDLSSWIERLLSSLREISAQELLPRLVRKDGEAAERSPTEITLRFLPSVTSGCYEVNVSCVKASPSVSAADSDHERVTLLSLSIEIHRNDGGGKALESVMRSCLSLIAEDPSQAVKQLVDGSKESGISERSRGTLLGAAAALDLLHGLEHSFQIGRRFLELSDVSVIALNQVAMCVFAASVRFYARNLRSAKSESDQLYFDVLMKGLNLGMSGAEAIYSLARKILTAAPKLGIPFYAQLVRIHPFYEERWYWHRDLGLAHYALKEFEVAAGYYDKALRLKPENSELYRYAGDAYFYLGSWTLALERYERAISIEPAEAYFLDAKIAFLRQKIRLMIAHEELFGTRRGLAARISSLGELAAYWKAGFIARALFRLALAVSPLDWKAAQGMALIANRNGKYEDAINNLQIALCNVPENPYTRLNLAVNIIFKEGGKWTTESKLHAKAALFHGGPAMKDRLRVLLSNTPARAELCEEFDHVLFEQVRQEREAWQARRRIVLSPQKFGNATHIEISE